MLLKDLSGITVADPGTRVRYSRYLLDGLCSEETARYQVRYCSERDYGRRRCYRFLIININYVERKQPKTAHYDLFHFAM